MTCSFIISSSIKPITGLELIPGVAFAFGDVAVNPQHGLNGALFSQTRSSPGDVADPSSLRAETSVRGRGLAVFNGTTFGSLTEDFLSS